ncbi:MAG: CBS domain-containing protein [Archangium sp.]|nr:CBS domain-containing protein [Archangium sp.]MDP3151928.1 CBS domain-containing protein [Archangium sp.]MDP3571341.1 CBS domain-containing protein [Archangium sp.]
MLQTESVAEGNRSRHARRAVKADHRAEENTMGDDLCGELISEELRTLECDLEISKGLEALDSAGVTSAPVVDDNGVLVGVVFLTALARLREAEELEVEDAMITDMVTVPQRATVAEVARLMAQHGLERVPVVTADGHVVGVVSSMDIVRWLADRL